MATVTFTIPDAVATELNNIAKANGYANAKAMVVNYLKDVVKTNRDNAIKVNVPIADVTDVVIS